MMLNLPRIEMAASTAVPRMISRTFKIVVLGASVGLAGCANFLPASGPSARDVAQAPADQPDLGIRVVELTDAIVRKSLASERRASLSETFGAGVLPRFSIGPGDALEISVWEAPPAALFGVGTTDSRAVSSSSRVSVLPEQIVNGAGTINMPFAGTVPVAGRTPEEVEQEIVNRLKSKANQPQVLVRVVRNASAMVTVVGEVNASARMPLSPRGERLLDALAATGGFKQPVGKITIRITREVVEKGRRTTRVVSLPLETLITDPAQNIILQPGDVVTALYQPNSFTVLGATTRNEEINFEAQGITLAQALGRAGGLQDQRANATAVFIFRFEDPAVLGETAPARTTADGKIPVIYRADLKEPASFFMAQDFGMRNKDVMYVANAPAAELQKFVNLISGVVIPVLTVRSLNNN
jgi:polysaccharide export outer membrane protein